MAGGGDDEDDEPPSVAPEAEGGLMPDTEGAVGGDDANVAEELDAAQRNMEHAAHRHVMKTAESEAHLTQLQQVVLSWDYFALGTEEYTPHSRRPQEVPVRFGGGFKEYREVFEPLILEEVTASVLRGTEGAAREIQQCVVRGFERARHGFHVATFTVGTEAAALYRDNDLVLVSHERPDNEDTDSIKYALGSVQTHEGAGSLRVLMFLPEQLVEGVSVDLIRTAETRAALSQDGSFWYIQCLCNLSTIQREWLALQSAHMISFLDVLLSGKPRRASGPPPWRTPETLMGRLAKEYNRSQQESLRDAMESNPVVLIQGPPGTGKTRTIQALLSVIMHAVPGGNGGMNRLLDDQEAAAASAARQSWDRQSRRAMYMLSSPWMAGRPNPRDAAGPSRMAAPAPRQVVTLGREMQRQAHVLICAPSNNALDEVVHRLITRGIAGASGETYFPTVVRVGLNPHHTVESVYLDNLVHQRLTASASKRNPGADPAAARAASAGEIDKLRGVLLDEANVVCSTLSFSGSAAFARKTKLFDVVVVDEASQACEPALLVPLLHGCKQLFLVGDPQQLPATVLSSTAQSYNYQQSMFKRLQLGGHPVRMLRTQYRMHPEIRRFPSAEFYEDSLLDGPDMLGLSTREWHRERAFAPYLFYDVDGRMERSPGGSWHNRDEAELACELVCQMTKAWPQLLQEQSIAVITPYLAQVRLVRRMLGARLTEDQAVAVDVNTIDGFQGREKDVAIFTAVRTTEEETLGFVKDKRRMNVGLTRARSCMLVVGCTAALERRSGSWGRLVDDSRRRGCLVTASKPYAKFVADLRKQDPPSPAPDATAAPTFERKDDLDSDLSEAEEETVLPSSASLLSAKRKREQSAVQRWKRHRAAA